MIELSFLRDREDDLALDVSTSGSLVRLSSIGKRECAIDGDAKRTRIQ